MRRWILAVPCVVALLAPATSGAETLPAHSTAAFRDSVGVNTHISYYSTPYGQWSRVVEKLDELGVGHLRDSVYANPAWGPWNERYYKAVELAAAHGMRFDFIMGYPNWGAGTLAELTEVVAGRLRGATASVEAPNEYDVFGGIASWVTPLRGYIGDLGARVAAEPRLAGVPVVGPSFGRAASRTKVGDVSDAVDLGNVHPYTGGDAPSPEHLVSELAAAAQVSGSKPVLATEAGFHNALNATSGQAPAPEDVAAVYTLRTLLEHFRAGIGRTFLYELIDQSADAGLAQPEQHFGLLRNDFSEKPAFVALRNLLRLLGRPAPTDDPEPVDVALEGETASVRRLLLQGPDGRYQLVLWLDRKVWDRDNHLRLDVPAQQVAVTLPADAATVARPVESDEKQPLAVSDGRVDVAVPADPIVIEFATGPPPPGAPAAPLTPAEAPPWPGPLAPVARPPSTSSRVAVRWCPGARGRVTALVGVRARRRFRVLGRARVLRRRGCTLEVQVAGVERLRRAAGHRPLLLRVTRRSGGRRRALERHVFPGNRTDSRSATRT